MYKLTIAVLFALFFIGAPASFRTHAITSEFQAEEQLFFAQSSDSSDLSDLNGEEFSFFEDSSSDDDLAEEELLFDAEETEFFSSEEADLFSSEGTDLFASEEETFVLPTEQFVLIDATVREPTLTETIAAWGF